MMMKSNVSRLEWLDCFKLFAIIAVLVDHTNGFLYTNQMIAYASYFSVTLFVFLGGVTSYFSNIRHEKELWSKDLKRKCMKLLIPYALATACYLLYNNHMLDLTTYVSSFIHFNASAPFYFILFYLQLLLISRILYRILLLTMKKKEKILWLVGECIILIIMAAVFMKYTYIMPVHGGGQYLFGGTYLPIYYMGMIFGAYYSKIQWTKLKAVLINICSAILTYAWVVFMYSDKLSLDTSLRYFGAFNPPGPSFFIYAMLVFIWGLSLNAVIDLFNLKVGMYVRKGLSYIGKYSLYVFLFHLLVITIFRNSIIETLADKLWMKIIIYYAGVILVCVLLGIVIEKVMCFVQRCMKVSKN